MNGELRPITGFVITGRGKAKEHIASEFEEFLTATNEKLLAGSLNLILRSPVLFDITKARTCSNGARLLWPARVQNKKVWIYRFPHAPLHVIEVLSNEHLRSRFDLDDGAEVTLEVPSDLLSPLSLRQWFAWQLVWRGRERWSYNDDYYYLRTRRFSIDIGATQRLPKRSVSRAIGSFIINGFR